MMTSIWQETCMTLFAIDRSVCLGIFEMSHWGRYRTSVKGQCNVLCDWALSFSYYFEEGLTFSFINKVLHLLTSETLAEDTRSWFTGSIDILIFHMSLSVFVGELLGICHSKDNSFRCLQQGIDLLKAKGSFTLQWKCALRGWWILQNFTLQRIPNHVQGKKCLLAND